MREYNSFLKYFINFLIELNVPLCFLTDINRLKERYKLNHLIMKISILIFVNQQKHVLFIPYEYANDTKYRQLPNTITEEHKND